MSRLVFLLEERSMKILLEGLLPRLVPDLPFLCVTHEGKQDLEKSIPRKLRAWGVPGDRFVIVRDNDAGDCHVLKDRLVTMSRDAGRADTMVRIPCQELEAWYLGEPDALARAYENPKLAQKAASIAGTNADMLQRPASRLAEILPEFQKIGGARRIAPHLSVEGNRSRSFQVFIDGIRTIASKLAAAAVKGD